MFHFCVFCVVSDHASNIMYLYSTIGAHKVSD